MISKSWAIVACLFMAIGCSSQKTGEDIVVYDEALLNDFSNYTEALSRKRAEIAFESGQVVNNCNAYILELEKSKVGEQLNDQLAKSEYLSCEVLTLVGNKVVISGSNSHLIGDRLASELDMTSFKSSLFQMLDPVKNTLKSIAESDLDIGNNSVTYETDEWVYELRLVAVADINMNHKSDWVIWLSDESKLGTYKNYQTLVIYDVPSSGIFKASTFQ